MVRKGELDAFVSIDGYGAADIAVPVVKIGSSDYYFAINKDRPDLLEDLNAAMSRIMDENPYYNQDMKKKYISTSGANLFFELHGKRVAFRSRKNPNRISGQQFAVLR